MESFGAGELRMLDEQAEGERDMGETEGEEKEDPDRSSHGCQGSSNDPAA